jgi:gluconokinase
MNRSGEAPIDVRLEDAQDPLVLVLDVGSTSSRAAVYDATATAVRGLEGALGHEFDARADGTVELDAERTAAEVSELITEVTASAQLSGRIRGVAMDTFASSLVPVDGTGQALTPCHTYADTRPARQVEELRKEMDEEVVQQRTGCRFHTSYLPARLRWFQQTQPSVWAGVARWLSLGEYIQARLTGRYVASFSTAAWTGLLNRVTAEWDLSLLSAIGATPDKFSSLHDTQQPLEDVGPSAAARWPQVSQAVWFPSVADGYASSLGSDATDETTMALSAATSGALRVLTTEVPSRVPPGLWCYRVDGRRSLLGGALNDVGRVLDWGREQLAVPTGRLGKLLGAPPGRRLPTVLPFLTGERSPGWAVAARAVFADVTDATTSDDLLRAAMEGVALRYALIARQLDEAAPDAVRVVASGGVTNVAPAWLQIAADALGRPITRVAEPRATLRGTALIALEVLAPDVARAPCALAETYSPNPEHSAYYREALARQEEIYAAVVNPVRSSQGSPGQRSGLGGRG